VSEGQDGKGVALLMSNRQARSKTFGWTNQKRVWLDVRGLDRCRESLPA
jgi:hypothetical protein